MTKHIVDCYSEGAVGGLGGKARTVAVDFEEDG